MTEVIGNSEQEKVDPFECNISMAEPEFPVKVMEPRRVEVLPPGEFLYQRGYFEGGLFGDDA